jgi:DNA-binding response OmpR family regulator
MTVINLEARGYEVDTAATGEASLERAASGHPDVVVLDLGLPGMNELLARLRAAIRRKLEPDPARPRHFVTEAGMGYRFEP